MDSNSSEVAVSHDHSGGHSCAECQGGVILRRTATPDAKADWAEGEVGERVALGFELAGVSEGLVTMRESFDDGRLAISIELGTGFDFFIARNGSSWEGRAISLTGGNGWRVRGEVNELIIEELEHGAMICSREGDAVGEVAGLPPAYGPLLPEEASAPEVGESLPLLLNSLEGANGVIYLDFDGETVSGTQWNSSYNSGNDIVARSPGYTDAKITSVWKGVAEDYRPFDVNVTTDRAVFDSYPQNRRAMLVFTPDNEWYGSSGGVAYVDVFGSSSFTAPGWVFTDQLANNAAYIAEAASHEAGHMLGLSHDGTSSLGYYEGHGSGATKWAPIMGVGYYSVVTQWSKGEYPDANRTQDDLQIISKSYNGLGYRTDDHGDSSGGATAMLEINSDQIEGNGIIEQNTDVDVYSFQTSGGLVTLNAVNGDYDPNLDIRLRLMNSSGGEVAVSDSDSSLDASISASVSPGIYFVEIEGTGALDLTTGYGDYGSLGGYAISGSAPRESVLFATINSPTVESLVISEGAGLVLDGSVSGGSPTWEVVAGPEGGTALFSDPSNSSTEVYFEGAGVYQLRLKTGASGEEVEDLLSVTVESLDALSANALSMELGPDLTIYADRVDLQSGASAGNSASVVSYLWTIISGSGQLSAFDVAAPELSFSSAGSVDLILLVDYGVAELFQEVSITASFSAIQLLASGSQGRTFSPTDGDLGSLWLESGFDDSQWQQGDLGVGYEVLTGSNTSLYSALIGDGLDVKSTMYKKTAGCYVRSTFDVQDASQFLSLKLSVCFDDGFVAYLNGNLIAESNVPSGSLSWDSLAPLDRPDSAALTPVEYEIEVLPGVLQDGINVLAVHGMNSAVSAGEREFLLVPEISAVVAVTPYSLTMGGISDSSLAATTADADGDGRSNLLEHGAGTSPTTSDDGFTLVGLLDELTAAVILPQSPPDDVKFTLLCSTELGESWTTLATRIGSGEWIGSPVVEVAPFGEGKERTCFSMGDGNRGFLRLKMELVAP